MMGLMVVVVAVAYPLPWIEALPSWSKCQFRQKKVRFLDHRATHLDAQDELIN